MNKILIKLYIIGAVLWVLKPYPAQSQDSLVQNTAQSPWQDQSGLTETTFGGDTLQNLPNQELLENKEWWKILGYEDINDLVTLALTENYQLAAVESQVRESEARVKLAKSNLFPTIGFNPSFYRQEFSGNRPLPFDIPANRITYNTYNLPIDVSFEVDLFGKNKNAVDANRLNLQAANYNLDASELDVAEAVTRNYILLLTLDSESEILNKTQSAREENLEIVSTRYQAGLTNEIDVQRAKSELSSVQVQLKNVQIERRAIETQLAALTSQPSQNFDVQTEGIQYFPPEISLVDTAGFVTDRPDLQAAKYQVNAYEKMVKSTRKQRYPSLNISGSGGLLAANSDQIFEGESRNWLLGASLSVPIFEGGRRQALLEISEQQLAGSEAQQKQLEVQANQEIFQQLSDLYRLKEQVTSQKEFLAAARRAAELSRQRYKKGLVTYLEVVDADRIVLEAERLSIQLLGQQLLSTVDLLTASGGNLEQFQIN